jgi:DNA polymerase-3 subunit gamma/tau
VCPSCIELSRDGGGSLDVVEIDAASHNGVDDARDLRERAVFAPARDRYKIFILDEAHMVTPQGFNALLKLVEEPPEHVKFIFATTEPEKVIGTIRSRTHHYPFRLIPPAQMLEYCESLCESESIAVEPGVLGLVVRAGGGSARDTLSLLDQLIAGSENNSVTYERAVSLLGYTHGALLDEAIDALAAGDSAAAFGAVDRVIQTGQDPRRFVEDVLERLRDLIVVGAAGSHAQSILRGVSADEVERMQVQAKNFGATELSRAADIVNASLSEMTGATSPRLHLELMIARLLVRSGVTVAPAVLAAPAEKEQAPAPSHSEPAAAPAAESVKPAAKKPTKATDKPVQPTPVIPEGPITTKILLEAWPSVLESIQNSNRAAWLVAVTAQVRSLDGDVLTLVFSNEADAASFRPQKGVPGGVHEIVRQAIVDHLGVRVAFKVSSDTSVTAPIEKVATADSPPVTPVAEPEFAEEAVVSEPEPVDANRSAVPAPEPKPADDGWDVVEIPQSEVIEESVVVEVAEPEPVVEDGRYGEAVVREILDAKFIGENITGPVPTVPEDQ